MASMTAMQFLPMFAYNGPEAINCNHNLQKHSSEGDMTVIICISFVFYSDIIMTAVPVRTEVKGKG